MIQQQIAQINHANAQGSSQANSMPQLAVSVTVPQVHLSETGTYTTNLGGAHLEVGHHPPYYLVTVTRSV